MKTRHMRYALLCVSLNHINTQFIKNALRGVRVYLFLFIVCHLLDKKQQKQEIIYLGHSDGRG